MTKIDKYLISREASIYEAMRVIEKGAIGVAFLVNSGNKLCGVISDGDIRRALLAGHHMNSRVSKVMNKKYVYARQNDDYSKIVNKLHDYIKVVPIVDRNKQVVDFVGCDKNARIPVASPSLMGNEYSYLTDAFLSTWISSTGVYINRFEREFSKFCSRKNGVATSNGTAALHLALVALGVGPGDEVIVPDFTFAASANAVLHAGAKPILVDVERDYWTIDPLEIEKAITPKTKAIMPVHIYGQPCNMAEIMKIAKKHKLFVVEDCAEAHGAEFNGRKVGSFGDIGCFSFFANKVITTGEGGMCVTNSEKLNRRMRVLRDHGMSLSKKYWHDEVGFNYRMTNMQAAVGCAQLERIDENLRRRRNLENRYKKVLSKFDFVKFQKDRSRGKRITWLVSVLVGGKRREKLLDKLASQKIDSRPFFYSLGKIPLYKKYLFSNKNSMDISAAGINLPTQNNLNEKELDRITNAIKES